MKNANFDLMKFNLLIISQRKKERKKQTNKQTNKPIILDKFKFLRSDHSKLLFCKWRDFSWSKKCPCITVNFQRGISVVIEKKTNGSLISIFEVIICSTLHWKVLFRISNFVDVFSNILRNSYFKKISLNYVFEVCCHENLIFLNSVFFLWILNIT